MFLAVSLFKVRVRVLLYGKYQCNVFFPLYKVLLILDLELIPVFFVAVVLIHLFFANPFTWLQTKFNVRQQEYDGRRQHRPYPQLTVYLRRWTLEQISLKLCAKSCNRVVLALVRK